MLLTRKGLRKVWVMTILYVMLGSMCILLSLFLSALGDDSNFLLVLGVIVYLLSVLVFFFGRYAEGKGKLIYTGNKLVRKELRPAAFLEEYDRLRTATDLVINQPSLEVLQLVAIAYDALDDSENCLKTVEEMIRVADDKKKAYVNLLKASFLFSYGQIEEAERLFNDTKKEKLDILSAAVADTILKGDRAMAMGDYKTVEAHRLEQLEHSFPKLDNLGKLVVHYQLGEVYEKWQDTEKAIAHYQYCATNGGETEIKASAKAAIERL